MTSPLASVPCAALPAATASSPVARSRDSGTVGRIADAVVVVVVAVVVVVTGACSPTYEVPVGWTLDGEDPATVCEFLPEGSVTRFTVESRDRSANRAGVDITETIHDEACGKGSATLPAVGSFADIVATVVANVDGGDGGGDDVVFGTSVPFAVAPATDETDTVIPTVVDIRVIRGTLHASLTVLGQACDVAGASSFTVSLFESTEAVSTAPVVEDVEVACEDGAAEFTLTPVLSGARYVIAASTTIGDATYGTPPSGQGVATAGANSFVKVDLQRR